MFGCHPRIPIDLVFNLQSPAEGITYSHYVDNWQSTMRQAYAIATSKSKARGETAKAYYHHKVRSSVLRPGDRVLIKNLPECGGPGEEHTRTLHRDLLFPCGDLFLSDPKVDAKPKNMRRSKGKTRKYPVRRQQLKQQAQDESSSESSEEDYGLTFLMPSELPSVLKNHVVPTSANEVSPLPASMPTLTQGELVPAPPDKFGSPNQSQSVASQDTAVATEMQDDFGHSALASSELMRPHNLLKTQARFLYHL